ncbi:MAG: hypothetical protein KC609_22690 [Myxococcales bacterium]|nr:hypothetical protein [Myxococcales bacterium]
MFHAQWLFARGLDAEAAWEQVDQVERSLRDRGIMMGPGGADESAEGVRRTVLVDHNPSVDASEAALIQVTEDPTLPAIYILIRASEESTFEVLLEAVVQHTDRVTPAELARAVFDAPSDRDALRRMGLGLVGTRYEPACYRAFSEVLAADDQALVSDAALVIGQLGWRSLLRPIHRALERLDGGSAARESVEWAFHALDWQDERESFLLPEGTSIDEAIEHIRTSLRALNGSLEHERLDAQRFMARDANGQVAIAAWEIDGMQVVELSPDWREPLIGAVRALRPLTIEERLAEVTAPGGNRLLRLVVANKKYHPTIDRLLSEGLRDADRARRGDALMAVSASFWESALPDVEALAEVETSAELRRLIDAFLFRHRGY